MDPGADNWVAYPDVKDFKVLVSTDLNIFDQNNEMQWVCTPPDVTNLASMYQQKFYQWGQSIKYFQSKEMAGQ